MFRPSVMTLRSKIADLNALLVALASDLLSMAEIISAIGSAISNTPMSDLENILHASSCSDTEVVSVMVIIFLDAMPHHDNQNDLRYHPLCPWSPSKHEKLRDSLQIFWWWLPCALVLPYCRSWIFHVT
ncbi:unnamed protein product [Cyprideis torosa]|uniref:Uncharacterized protein n=1 Tax=Cyprideis torosa TaxID=163714 RepID=A0A7R8WLD7_9CRUS|nr:unnamed protein product [Cyprideis torosa]CAG0898083.1 unnamed protein product [Cyprideis torosa]